VASHNRPAEETFIGVAGAPEEIERMTLLMRVQHIILAVSCIILILTGMPLRYPDSAFAELVFRLAGGVGAAGVLHRIGATALTLVGVFHMGYVAFTREGREQWKYLLPRVKDVLDVLLNVAYFFGLRRHRPRFDRFSYFEKFDYWAVYWGCVIMIGSGVVLWFHEYAMRFLPKVAVDVAHEAHSDEGLLATLAIVIWHFYNVHFNPDRFPMSWVWWTGKMSREDMLEHHPLEYERIAAEPRASEPDDGGTAA
jgi:cytochrome b subunit of formate dehydrogenase